MCNSSKCFQAVSIGVSILVGIAMLVLSLFGLLVTGLTIPLVGIVFSVLCLLLLTIAASSLLKQDRHYNACLCREGLYLLAGALLLLIVSGFTLVFLPVNLVISLILIFLIFALLTYTLFALYAVLCCLVRAGCGDCDA